MITFSLPWWLIPLALAVAGIVIPAFMPSSRGDYDFVSPLYALGVFLICEVAAFAFMIGRWVS